MSNLRRLLGLCVVTACVGGFTGTSNGALVTYSFTTADGSAPTDAVRATTNAGAYTNGTNTNFDPESPSANATFSQLTSAQFALGQTGETPPLGAVSSLLGATNNGSPYTIDGHAYEVTTRQMTDKTGATPDSTSGYLQFTVTPASGYQINYSTFTFDFGYDSNSTANGSVGAKLLYSTNGVDFTAALPDTTQTVTFAANSYSIANDVSRDITGLGTQTGTVTFRLALADTGSNVNNKLLFVDDLNLNGEISPVPEPASFGLAVIGLAPLLAARRRARA